MRGNLREANLLGLVGIARKHEHKAIGLARGIGAHAIGQASGFVEIWHCYATAAAIVGPAVIVAGQPVAFYRAQMQRNLAMGAAILQGKYVRLPGVGGRANQHDRFAGELDAKCLAGLQVARARQGIPKVGIDSRFAQIGRRNHAVSQWGDCHRYLSRTARPHSSGATERCPRDLIASFGACEGVAQR